MGNSKMWSKGALVAGTIGVIACLSGGVAFMPRAAYAQNQAAQTEIRFQQLEKEIRRLTGQIEEQQYDIRQLRGQLADLQGTPGAEEANSLAPANGVMVPRNINSGVDFYAQGGAGNSANSINSGNVAQAADFENETVQSLGTYSMPTASMSAAQNNQNNNVNRNAAPEKPGNPNVIQASTGNAAKDYDRAYSFIKERDFENAEKAFDVFIKAYPNDDLVSNAKYWYGETFYVRGDYNKAARVFAEGYQKHPQGQKAASNLLKLGMSLVGMGKPDDACIAFKQLKKDYSNSAIPVLKRADTEMGKISCQ